MSSAIVIGAGPGIGASVARRLGREGLAVGLIARSRRTLDVTAATVPGTVFAAAADVAREDDLRAALDDLIERAGVPELLVYNVALIQADAPGTLTAAQHLDAYAVNVVGAITAVAHVGPRMAAARRGTIVLTGGMPEPVPEVTSLSLGKAGIRALTQLLARAYEPRGVHVATVTVGGTVASGTAYDPDDIADHYWRLHTQNAGAWEREVVYG